jgi:hypothetical protein
VTITITVAAPSDFQRRCYSFRYSITGRELFREQQAKYLLDDLDRGLIDQQGGGAMESGGGHDRPSRFAGQYEAPIGREIQPSSDRRPEPRCFLHEVLAQVYAGSNAE